MNIFEICVWDAHCLSTKDDKAYIPSELNPEPYTPNPKPKALQGLQV